MRRTGIGLIMVLVVSVLPGVPVRAAAAASTPSRAQADRSVPVMDQVVTPPATTRVEPFTPPRVDRPRPASRVVDVPAGGGASVEVGGLPVALSAKDPATVRVEVLDRETAGTPGAAAAVRLSRAGWRSGPALVGLSVDYSRFAGAYGGDWAGRLRLATLPGPVWLPGTADPAAQTVSAEVDLAGEALVVLAAGPTSDSGDFAQSDLKASYSWVQGGPSGDFSWSYPMDVPEVPGGLVPSVGLGYSSGAVDGQTAGQNAQPSWVGEGWGYSPPFVERTYRPCFDDRDTAPHWTYLNDKPYLCWRAHNAHVVLDGKATEIIRGDDGVWRLADDDGEKVELLTGASNADDNGEHWRITATDGTQYWFGRHVLPSGRGSTNSTAGVRVFANHDGEPCFSSSLLSSYCTQAYRWMLDYVVDPHGNEISYWYTASRNASGYRLQDDGVGVIASYGYDRDVRPLRIEYGSRVGDATSASPPARVVFSAADRCLQDCREADATPKAASWPDTPWDLQCETLCADTAPTFFGSTRLAGIQTQVLDGGTYRTVDRWDLTHQFPATGNTTSPVLWLAAIAHTAFGSDGSTVAFPPVTFEGTRMPNRAFYDPAASNAPQKYRLTAIYTETGGQIRASYSVPGSDCLAGVTPPSPHSNGRRCFPRGTGSGQTWWHKYTVYQVIERDLVGGSPDVVSTFSMGNTGASTSVKWAFENGPAVWGASVDRRTWSDWRGWPRVTVTVGSSSGGARSQSDYLYFRGLHGDRADPSGASRTSQVDDDIFASTFTDNWWRAGQLLQERMFDVAGGTPVELTRWVPTQINTGTRTVSSVYPSTFRSYIARVNQERSWDWDPVTGSWQIGDYVDYTVDSLGRTVAEHDRARATCTRTTYVDNTVKRLLEFVAREQVNSGACDAPADLLADTRYSYDGLAFGAAPTAGNLTRTEVYGPSGWFVDSTTGYDGYGRVTFAADALGRTTTTAYSHNADRRLVGTVVTNPAGHVSTTVLEPRRGLPVTVTDANGKTTTAAYDAAGRLVRVWSPGRPTTGAPDAEYAYSVTRTAPSHVSSRVLGPNGNQIASYEIYDGLLRPRQAQQIAPDGKRVITDTGYEHRGLVAKETTFYNAASGPSSTMVGFADVDVDRQVRYVYDGQEREVSAQQWSRGQTLFETVTLYGFRSVAVVPPAGGTVTRELYDQRGNVVALRQYHTSNPNGTAHDESSYAYDPLDRLVSHTDRAGNTWTYGYDLAGRLVSTSDPDSGTSTMSYNNAGELTTIQDSRVEVLSYRYDALGRRTAVDDTRFPHTPVRLAEWTYDTLAKGQLTSATRFHGGLAYVTAVTGYDDGARPLGTSVTIPASPATGGLAGTYTTRYTYRADGTLATEALPAAAGLAAETLTHSYTDQGLPATTTGLDAYLAAAVHRWDGTVAETRHGAAGRQVRQSYAYEEATGRLTAAQVDAETQPGVFAGRYTTEYGYDHVGNVKAVAGKTGGARDQVECFRYDHLRRLTEAWTAATWDCSAAPQRAGADPYHRTWTFDAAGNRLSQTDHDPAAGNTVWTHHVGAANGVRPHQVARVTATGPRAGAAERTFAYDAAGNLTGNTTETGAVQTLTWDAEGRLGSVTAGTDATSYVYDASGDLLVSREPGVSTLHLGATEVSVSASGTAAVRYYDDVAVRTAAGLFWAAADRNGTPVAQTNAGTLESDRRRMMPFGEPRGDQPDWEGNRGFVGGAVDGTSLTRLGARSYVPSLGQFTSVDPELDSADPVSWHGYAYAGHSPITFADPDGRSRICVDVCGSPADRSVQRAQNNNKKGKPKAVPSRNGKSIAGPSKKGKPAGPSKKGKPKAGPSKSGKKPSAKGGGPSIGKGKREVRSGGGPLGWLFGAIPSPVFPAPDRPAQSPLERVVNEVEDAVEILQEAHGEWLNTVGNFMSPLCDFIGSLPGLEVGAGLWVGGMAARVLTVAASGALATAGVVLGAVVVLVGGAVIFWGLMCKYGYGRYRD